MALRVHRNGACDERAASGPLGASVAPRLAGNVAVQPTRRLGERWEGGARACGPPRGQFLARAAPPHHPCAMAAAARARAPAPTAPPRRATVGTLHCAGRASAFTARPRAAPGAASVCVPVLRHAHARGSPPSRAPQRPQARAQQPLALPAPRRQGRLRARAAAQQDEGHCGALGRAQRRRDALQFIAAAGRKAHVSKAHDLVALGLRGRRGRGGARRVGVRRRTSD